MLVAFWTAALILEAALTVEVASMVEVAATGVAATMAVALMVAAAMVVVYNRFRIFRADMMRKTIYGRQWIALGSLKLW